MYNKLHGFLTHYFDDIQLFKPLQQLHFKGKTRTTLSRIRAASRGKTRVANFNPFDLSGFQKGLSGADDAKVTQ